MAKEGKIIIFSAPSGSGKSSIIAQIINNAQLDLEFSTSATTRLPRGQEVDGKDYYFMSIDDFKAAIAADEFAEYQEVYPGRFYGTLKREIARINAMGKNVLLDIDVLGGLNVKQMYGDRALSIFVKVPSIVELRHRLYARGTDTVEEIEKRVAKAEFETGYADKFDCIVVNDVLDQAVTSATQAIAGFIA